MSALASLVRVYKDVLRLLRPSFLVHRASNKARKYLEAVLMASGLEKSASDIYVFFKKTRKVTYVCPASVSEAFNALKKHSKSVVSSDRLRPLSVRRGQRKRIHGPASTELANLTCWRCRGLVTAAVACSLEACLEVFFIGSQPERPRHDSRKAMGIHGLRLP
jgi:hypothetical protein